jgi:hypothetical protein
MSRRLWFSCAAGKTVAVVTVTHGVIKLGGAVLQCVESPNIQNCVIKVGDTVFELAIKVLTGYIAVTVTNGVNPLQHFHTTFMMGINEVNLEAINIGEVIVVRVENG